MATGQAGTRAFSNEAYKRGDLKRRLAILPLATMNADIAANPGILAGTFTFRAVLKNLAAGLSISLAVAPVGFDSAVPILPAQIPPLAITWQATPVLLFPDAPPTYLRPIFHNPAIANNSNNPLPQDVPFGWEFETVADEIWIDVTVNATLLHLSLAAGRIAVFASVEYTGNWPYPEAVKWSLTQVQLIQAGEATTVFNTNNS